GRGGQSCAAAGGGGAARGRAGQPVDLRDPGDGRARPAGGGQLERRGRAGDRLPPGGDSVINVLIVDDSLFMRQAVRRILSADARLRVIGEARDGTEGVEQVIRLQPDVVTMDFNMPGLTGAEAVREIMRLRPTPIVMLSAHTQAGARETLEALAAGAVDFLPKPSGEVSADFSRIQNALVQKVLAAAQAHPRVQLPVTPPPARPIGRTTWPASGPRVVVIAVSTGGPAALGRVLPPLPGCTPFGLVVVQHMPAEFTL